jgi:antitoxin component YwqK of YwqJK toxin-antitoxin module
MLTKTSIFFTFFISILSLEAQGQYELYGKDTINRQDALNRKQGKWIIFGSKRPNSCYTVSQKVEEGKYGDNKKTGQWREYYCNSNPKSILTFNNGRPDGSAVMYHENGKVSEEGVWKNQRWTGAYKLYYPNGQVQHEFNYNTSGKREGKSVYYYENGEVAIEGSFADGKETGVFKEFYENGETKAVKEYNGGLVNTATLKEFELKNPVETVVKKVKPAAAAVVKVDETTVDNKKSKGPLNGHHVLYDKQRRVSKDGEFVNNVLVEGKSFVYDDNGILIRIAYFKEGSYAGDLPIEK